MRYTSNRQRHHVNAKNKASKNKIDINISISIEQYYQIPNNDLIEKHMINMVQEDLRRHILQKINLIETHEDIQNKHFSLQVYIFSEDELLKFSQEIMDMREKK